MKTIGQEAGKSYAYLLGVYLGDGCITKQYGKWSFKVNTIDEDFAIAIQSAIDCLGFKSTIYKHSVKKSHKPNYLLWCYSQALCNDLLNDCGGESNPKSRFPFFTVRDNEGAFIVGLMDSEGFVAEKTENKTGRAYYMGYKSCDPWVPRLLELMKDFGLRFGKVQTERPLKPGYKAPTRVTIKMQSWVDSGLRFNIKRKQERVDRWASTVPYSERSRYPRRLTPETIRQSAQGA